MENFPFQDYKEFIDAEGLHPLPTSDFHNPVCLEMKSLKNHIGINAYGILNPGLSSFGFSTTTLPLETPLRTLSLSNNNNNYNNNSNYNNFNSNSADLASVDSSETYASCQTHPFLSQGDLTSDMMDATGSFDLLDTNNLYINPLEKNSDDSQIPIRMQFKKSASGDTGLRSLGASPMDEEFQSFQSFGVPDRGSRVSLNEMTPVPKHRKTRFQQQQQQQVQHQYHQQQHQHHQQHQQHQIQQQTIGMAKQRTRFDDVTGKASQESLNYNENCGNNISGTGSMGNFGSGKKNRRSSFMPAKSLASATKLINQHLFGIQN